MPDCNHDSLYDKIDAAISNSDHEAAHRHEDELYLATLRSIARGDCPDPQRCAALAAATQALPIKRWCA